MGEFETAGVNLEWFGIDETGQLAVFISSGCGVIPMLQLERHHEASHVREDVDALPAKTKKRLALTTLLADPGDGDPARVAKGVYVYDTGFYPSDVDFYYLSAIPKQCTLAAALSERSQSFLQELKFTGAHFGRDKFIYPAKHFRCIASMSRIITGPDGTE